MSHFSMTIQLGAIMCVICLEFQRSRDLIDARRMLESARNEPKSIDAKHLDEVERKLSLEEEKARSV